jgi:hypothetical protein
MESNHASRLNAAHQSLRTFQQTAARALYRSAKRAAERYRNPRPIIPISDYSVGSTVYFLTPDDNVPSGGIQITYRHVDILNEAGIDAAVLHQHKGFRCTWFDNATRVTDIRSSSVGPNDFLVISGLDVDLMIGLRQRVRHVVLNQGAHASWMHRSDEVTRHYIDAAGLLGVVTVSEHSAQMLRYAYPRRSICRVYNRVDNTLFYPPGSPKPRRISYFPRRGRYELEQVLQLLHARGSLRGWELVPLDGMDQHSFATGLRSSRITLNLSSQEGFGLPAAEAMACGSYVIGFTAFGSREFMRSEFSCPVETGDALAVAEAVERTIVADTQDSEWCRVRGLMASAFVLDEYSPQRERESVIFAYSTLLKAAGAGA